MERMTLVGALVVTISMLACGFFLLIIASFASNPFGEPDLTGRIGAWVCGVLSVPTSGAGAFIAYRQRRTTTWLLIAMALSLGTAVYALTTLPSS